jgi:hypothetical protein
VGGAVVIVVEVVEAYGTLNNSIELDGSVLLAFNIPILVLILFNAEV